MADLLQKITDGIDRGIKTISSKSKEFIDVSRLKGELKNADAALQLKFNSLGKRVFQMMNQGALNAEDLTTECAEISSCYRKIAEIEDNIKRAEREALNAQYGDDAIMCRACGGINKTTDKLCNICGSSLSSETKVNNRPCPACNASVSAEAKFCACGSAMPKDADIQATPLSEKVCNNCRKQISAEEIFCQSCGTRQ
jgi:RNA polymerase subunit RPABC4/transcription elongation factor Spt4